MINKRKILTKILIGGLCTIAFIGTGIGMEYTLTSCSSADKDYINWRELPDLPTAIIGQEYSADIITTKNINVEIECNFDFERYGLQFNTQTGKITGNPKEIMPQSPLIFVVYQGEKIITQKTYNLLIVTEEGRFPCDLTDLRADDVLQGHTITFDADFDFQTKLANSSITPGDTYGDKAIGLYLEGYNTTGLGISYSSMNNNFTYIGTVTPPENEMTIPQAETLLFQNGWKQNSFTFGDDVIDFSTKVLPSYGHLVANGNKFFYEPEATFSDYSFLKAMGFVGFATIT